MEPQSDQAHRQRKRPRHQSPLDQAAKGTVDDDDFIVIDISNRPGQLARWTIGPVSRCALIDNNDYFAALLAGGFQEATARGRAFIVLPLHDETPLCAVEALVRRAAGQHDSQTSVALACLESYGGVEGLSFLGLPSYDDILRDALGPEPALGHLADPFAILMAYLRREIMSDDLLLASPDTAFAFPEGVDRVPSTLWMPYVRYGERLYCAALCAIKTAHDDAIEKAPDGASCTCADQRQAIKCALVRMLSAIDEGQRAVAIARALTDALQDWRRSMFLDNATRTIVDQSTTTDPFVNVDPVCVGCSGNATARPLCVVPDIHTFRRQLCTDFPCMGPLLLREGGPFSPMDDRSQHGIVQQASIILAGGSVVNALQSQGLCHHLDSSDLDLWVVGPDPEARRATFDRVVSWIFSQLPDDRCKARVRFSIVTITINDCDSGVDDDLADDMCPDSDEATSSPKREYIQVIMTDAHTPDALVGGFDMAHACAWFDGMRVGATWDCLRAIATRTTRPLPGVRPVISRYDKAKRKGFIPTWDRSESPECDPSWSYDDEHATSAHDPHRRADRGYTSAHDTLAVFSYAPLVRRQPSEANHRYQLYYIPGAEPHVYTGDLKHMRFKTNGRPSGFCVSPQIGLVVTKATTTGSARLISPSTKDQRLADYVIPIAFCPSTIQCASQPNETATDVLVRHDALVRQLIDIYRTLLVSYVRNQTAHHYSGQSVIASSAFMESSYRPVMFHDSAVGSNGVQAIGQLDIVWCNRNRMFDATSNTPIEPGDVAAGSQVSGTVCIIGVRLDDQSHSLRVMVDTSFLWVYPPEHALATTLTACAAASVSM
nr:hypothetical protein [Pandoravirus aubagnensis]